MPYNCLFSVGPMLLHNGIQCVWLEWLKSDKRFVPCIEKTYNVLKRLKFWNLYLHTTARWVTLDPTHWCYTRYTILCCKLRRYSSLKSCVLTLALLGVCVLSGSLTFIIFLRLICSVFQMDSWKQRLARPGRLVSGFSVTCTSKNQQAHKKRRISELYWVCSSTTSNVSFLHHLD